VVAVVIFLDFDGVLRISSDAPFDPACVGRVCDLAASTESRIVAISAWCWVRTKEQIQTDLHAAGLADRLHADWWPIRDPVRARHSGKTDVIRDWLNRHPGEVGIVVDDDKNVGKGFHRLRQVNPAPNVGFSVADLAHGRSLIAGMKLRSEPKSP
jgi:hypothetical protein